MMNPIKFWNYMAKSYAKKPVEDEASYQHKLQKSREYFTKNSNILEIGCGTGSTAISHAPYVNTILATDISDRMIDISNQKLTNNQIDNIVFQHISIDDLNIKDETYDAILALSILHLLKDKDQAIAKIYKMLKPNGVLITSTVCLQDSSIFAKFLTPIGRLFGLILKPLSKNNIEKSMQNCGFKIDYSWTPANSTTAFIIAKK